jgi:hypothetical protein
MANKEVVYSAAEQEVLRILASATGPMSLEDINAVASIEIKTGTMTSLKKKGRISASPVEVEVVRPVKTKHNVYSAL